MEYVSRFIPFVALSLTNQIIQAFIEELVTFEKWDFPDQEIKSIIWRNYAVKIANLFVFLKKKLD
jgi:hypothetical protein